MILSIVYDVSHYHLVFNFSGDWIYLYKVLKYLFAKLILISTAFFYVVFIRHMFVEAKRL